MMHGQKNIKLWMKLCMYVKYTSEKWMENGIVNFSGAAAMSNFADHIYQEQDNNITH
jgi:hypothetical protein